MFLSTKPTLLMSSLLNKLFKSFWVLLYVFFGIQYMSHAQSATNSYSVNKMKINSSHSDISPVILPNGLVFISNKEDELAIARTSTHQEPFYKIFFAEKTGTGYKKAIRISGDVNEHFSEGPISFAPGGDYVYFTRNIPLPNPTKTGKKARLGIFTATYRDGDLVNVQPFIYNKPDYSLAHPAISSNGNFMIFASNLPGGFGGSDLYVTYNKNGEWDKPINLGKEINTLHNEVFPFVNSDGKLYFSSDGHKGLGGLDIFSAGYLNFEWKGVHNLGAPFNSVADDFGYTESADKMMGFFSSDRDENTRDDIYQFQVSPFVFTECDTLKELNYCRTFYEEGTFNTDSLPLMYEWNFGNGIKKRGLEVSHCFEKPGVYQINLNIIDLITNSVYMNEATYDIDITPIRGPYFSLPDTVVVGVLLDLNATKSKIEKSFARNYFWDLGDGTILDGALATHSYASAGEYHLRLGVNFIDSANATVFSKCVVKNLKVETPDFLVNKKRFQHKPFYEIRDKSGNTYKIQLATSRKKLNLNSYFFKEIGGVEEYFDRGVFGYTVGNFTRPELCYPELKRVREKGFKEAVVIALKDNKVVSGSDSSFFVNLPHNFAFVRVVSMHGKVMDHNGRPVHTTIKLDDLYSGVLLEEFTTDSLTGSYKIDLPVDKAYSYHIYQNGYFPFSNFIDLAKRNDLLEIRSDIFLMGLEKMRKDSMPIRVNNIFFDDNNVNLKTESEYEIKRLTDFFGVIPNAKLVIESHTDNLGDKYSKKIFSQQRALAVKEVMVKNGFDPGRIIIRAFGESKPLTLNPKLQHINNRIEMMMRMD